MFSSLSTVTGPVVEPITVAFAKQHTRIDNDADDNLVAVYITAARTWAEMYLGRVLVAQQLIWTLAVDQIPNGYPQLSMPLTLLVLPQWFNWQLWRNTPIELPRQPVISVDGVAYGQWGAPDVVLAAGTDYDADVASARIWINPGSIVLPNDHLAITFTAGYSADASLVPMPMQIAIAMMTAFLYEQRGDAGGEPPPAATMLLVPYRQITVG